MFIFYIRARPRPLDVNDNAAVTSTTSLPGEHSKESNRFKRQALLQHANKDQINAVSEMVLNLLKNNIPVKPQTLRTLQRHKNVLREVGKRKNSVKRRRQHLLKQTGVGFWRGLKACYGACRCRRVTRRGTR